ncbi:DUF58 domain-containing protein [Paraliomyxa miuraensis]|uniref:DUF58 domain-containing protein n=1 Tax=Paraliomyxa miuraensis TaxID=376150 RepID=UPI0022526CA3|nr:DUF58 domain-containing protein [Paraliomyxa miuraensis]MCX4247355.1 DUF58 domain-containing protein [Paraliomyxa miuraensis]
MADREREPGGLPPPPRPAATPATSDGGDDGNALGRLVPAPLRELLRARPLLVRRPVWGQRHGRHAAARAGLGLDFRDHRAYVPGDDPRRLDWRAVARRERLVLRRTESEDELSLVLVLDGGGGMAYGEGPQQKLAYAHAIAGGLAWMAHRQGDPVGLSLGRQQAVDVSLTRPRSGRERLSALAQRLTEAPPLGRCPWISLMNEVAPRLPRRSLVVVLSDLLDPGMRSDDADEVQDELLRGLAQLRARQHDVVIVQVLHPDELTFPWAERSMLRFEDLRELRAPLEAPGRSLRDEYLRRLAAHLHALDDRCEAEGLVLVRVSTGQPVQDAFMGMLARLAGEAGAATVEVEVPA